MSTIPFARIFTSASRAVIAQYEQALTRLMAEYDINTTLRQAHFLSQIAQESGELRFTEENLKYSASRLLQVFPRYFKSLPAAQAVAFDPQRIANIVYANRIGNGDTASGDGYRFRGRGLIQLTGRANYEAYVRHLLTLSPEHLDDHTRELLSGHSNVSDQASAIASLISQPEHAVRSACWFWQRNGLNALADRGGNDSAVELVTRRVNGGTNGLSQRKVYFYRALVVLKNM